MKRHQNHGGSRHNGRKAKIASRHAENRKRKKPTGNPLRPHNGLKPGHRVVNGIIQAGPVIQKGG